ncbi:MAG TPA: hypothetical protein VN944_06850 [Nitrospiria bacterium]|nr:hypothetical protein [Nitrospiria bacterium]
MTRKFFHLLVSVLFISILFPGSAAAGKRCLPAETGGEESRVRPKTVPKKFEAMDVNQFLQALTPNLKTSKYRKFFSPAQNEYLEKNENRAITLEGFLLDFSQEMEAEVPCKSPAKKELRLWVGAGPVQAKSYAVLVELPIHSKDKQDRAKLGRLQVALKRNTKIKISGWVLYNPENPDQYGRIRGTLWEISPITRIEIWENGKWKEL